MQGNNTICGCGRRLIVWKYKSAITCSNMGIAYDDDLAALLCENCDSLHKFPRLNKPEVV